MRKIAFIAAEERALQAAGTIAARTGETYRSGGRGGPLARARYCAVAAAVAAVLGTTLPTAPSYAQEDALEEITVTGSRIRRRDFSANSPITTLDSGRFEETSSVGIERVLNELPQFVPAVTQFTTTDVQNTATNTVGASVVSLRGLGANRNLVLIDGRRGQPVNSTMVVDTNSIPAAAIERVEVISGGASAVYGADAVGGVVNFILKNDFEGATIDVRYGETFEGDGSELTVSGLIGTNINDGRGNIMVGIEHSDRGIVRQIDRDWRLDDFANPNILGNGIWFSNTFITSPGNPPSQAAIDQIYDQLPPGTISPLAEIWINETPDGTGTVFSGVSTQFGAGSAPAAYRFAGSMEDPRYPGLPFRKRHPDGRITENILDQWASIPLDRYSGFARGRLELSDSLTFTSQMLFSRTRTQTNLGLTSNGLGPNSAVIPHGNEIYAPSLASDGTTLPAYQAGGSYGLNCPPVGGCTESQAFPLPPEVEFLLSTRPDPNGDVRINRIFDFVRDVTGTGRRSRSQTTTFQLTMGLEGELPGGHVWDVSYSHGQTENVVNFDGIARREQWRILAASPNFGVSFIRQGNQQGAGFAGGIATCESGLPLVRDFPMSPDCAEMLIAKLQNNTQIEQEIFEANVVGSLAEMRAGPLQYALGATHRYDNFAFHTDSLSTNESFADNAIGVFPTSNSFGEFDVNEVYGELLVPLARGVPGVEHFNLELGGRISDFSTVGKLETYKTLVDWAITPRYRLRGGFNRAHRAPNLGELFLSRTQTVGGTGGVFGDQCSQNNQDGPFSANPNANRDGAAGAARTLELCRAMMSPTAVQTYYESRDIEAQPLGGPVGLANTTGNPNLSEEQADTFTLGVVMNLFDNFTVTVDYYTIEINDMIAVSNADAVFEACLSPATNPSADPEHPACRSILRDPFTGEVVSTDLSFTNEGRAKTSGVDLQLNWQKMLRRGGINLNVLANYNIENITQARPDLPEIDWAGTDGCALQLQCMGYDYRVFTTVGYFQGPFTVSLRWQHWPSIKAAAYATNPQTPMLGVTTSYDLFALTGSYRINDRFTFRGGIENLFDRDPPRSGGNPAARPFPLVGTHAEDGATYDPLGRRFFVSFTMDF
ncbi:MAG TPA: TonB-dependent receptor [Gammaproteobacteria bacterium]